MLVKHGIGRLGPALEETGDLGLAGLDEMAQEAQGRRVAGELVVVEQDPAQHLAALVVVLPAEGAELFDEIVEDHAGLRQPPPFVLEHRDLAHLVDAFAEGRRTGGAVEKVDPGGLPVGAGELQHQRRLVRVARLGKAMEHEFGHRDLTGCGRSGAS